MLILAIICGVVSGLLCSIMGRHAGTMWAAIYATAYLLGVIYSEVIADDIGLTVAGATLVSFGSAKVLNDTTDFLERKGARAT